MIAILGVGIHLWLYQTLITDTFYSAPTQLAAAMVGAPSVVTVIDQIWTDGNLAAEQLLAKGSMLSADFAYYLAGFFVYLLVGLTAVYTAFLLALSKIALSIIIALGPLFIAMLFFDSTKRFFESWVAQLANYALIVILATAVAALLLSVVRSYTSAAAALGGGITIAEGVRVCIASVLIFLVMRQVMPMASGLASGIALSTYGVVSSALSRALGVAASSGYQFSRGVLDGRAGEAPSRWDSMRRRLGNRVGRLGYAQDARPGGKVSRDRVMPPPSVWR
jgi:type IV secretion system protein VirB6